MGGCSNVLDEDGEQPFARLLIHCSFHSHSSSLLLKHCYGSQAFLNNFTPTIISHPNNAFLLLLLPSLQQCCYVLLHSLHVRRALHNSLEVVPQGHIPGKYRLLRLVPVVDGGMAVAPSRSEAAGVTESGMFSQSDNDLSSSGLTVHSTIDDLDLDQLNALFAKVSFPCREKEKLLQALEHTQSLLWIQDTRSKQLIAFARATGDNVFNAIIWDVVVDPSYQGLGLGKVLMERLMAALVKMGISNIALYAEPNVVGFYQPLGFISDPDAIRAMAYSRRR